MKINPTINEVGLEQVKLPVKQVKLIYHENRWHINYKLQKSFFWKHDSMHTVYADALSRMNAIRTSGIYIIKNKSTSFKVK